MTLRRILLACLIILTWPVVAQADEGLLLGRGVNIELWASSFEKGAPKERIDLAKKAGFTFVRLGISVRPWLRDEIVRLVHRPPAFTQGDADKQKAKTFANLSEAITTARANGMKPLVALFVVGLPAGLRPGRILCDIPDGQRAFEAAFNEILRHIPDLPDIVIEPFNEPPGGCGATATRYATAMGTMWSSFQWRLYQTVRKEKPHLVFVVSGGDYDRFDGLLASDPRRLMTDKNTVMTIHYYEPKLFTCQSGACDHRPESFARNIPWPIDAMRLAKAQQETLAELEQKGLAAADREETRAQLVADFAGYGQKGTISYLDNRFRQLADWANRYQLDPARILVGEFGVHRPTNDTTGTPIADAGRYLLAVRQAAEAHHFSWAIWDLDGGMAFLCGIPPHEEVCPSYRPVIATTP